MPILFAGLVRAVAEEDGAGCGAPLGRDAVHRQLLETGRGRLQGQRGRLHRAWRLNVETRSSERGMGTSHESTTAGV